MSRFGEEDKYIPPRRLKTNRNPYIMWALLTVAILSLILLIVVAELTNRIYYIFIPIYIISLIAFSIYSIFFYSSISADLKKVFQQMNLRRHPISFSTAYLFALVTGSITLVYWNYDLAVCIEEALRERDLHINFSTNDFWTWRLVGSVIPFMGYVFEYKLINAINLLCEDYNEVTSRPPEERKKEEEPRRLFESY